MQPPNFPRELRCTYCGVSSDMVREHVIPASYFGQRTYDPTKQWIVEACRTCNDLAGAAVFFSVPQKAAWLIKRYREKFAKLLRVPIWTDDEIAEMGYKFQVSITESSLAKRLVLRKIGHLEAIAGYPEGYLRPKWAERESRVWAQREMERRDWEKAERRKRKLTKRRGAA